MPATYSIDSRRKLVPAFASGLPGLEPLASFLADLAKDPDFIPACNLLFDASSVVEFRVSSSDPQRVAQIRLFSKESRLALSPRHSFPLAWPGSAMLFKKQKADSCCEYSENEEDRLTGWMSKNAVSAAPAVRVLTVFGYERFLRIVFGFAR